MCRAERMPAADPVRAFLASAIEARIEYRRHQRRVKELDSRSNRLSANLTGMPGGGGEEHSQEAMWSALADARSAELDAMQKHDRTEKEVNAFIDSLSTPLYRSLLRLKYLDGLTWVQMTFALREAGVYYSVRQLQRHHGYALSEARELWLNMQKEKNNE